MKISIIIPTFNEEKNIANTLGEVSEYINKEGIVCELIISDDGSNDRTIDECEKIKDAFKDFRIVKNGENKGKGHAIRMAVKEASGDHILFMDADSATSIREFDKFKGSLGSYDIVTATRRMPGADTKVTVSRRFLGSIYIILGRIILGINVSDPNCGFKLFTNPVAKKLFASQKMDDWSFDSEIFFLATKEGYSIKEVPVKWVHGETSKVSPIKDGWRSFLSLVKIRGNDMRGMYR